MRKLCLLIVLSLLGVVPLFAMDGEMDGENQPPKDTPPLNQRRILVSSFGSDGSSDDLKRSFEGLPPHVVLLDSVNADRCSGGKARTPPLNRSGDAWEISSDSGSERVSTPPPPIPMLFCSKAVITKYKPAKMPTWVEVMQCIYKHMGTEIKPSEVALIADNDGSLNTHPDPSKPCVHPFGERENALTHLREAKESGMHIFVSSAWATPDFMGDQKGFQQTLDRLGRIHCDPSLLNIEGDLVETRFTVQLCKEEGAVSQTISLTGIKAGHVVSCKKRYDYALYLREKFYAPMVAEPDLCSTLKLVVLVDDSVDNIRAFQKAYTFNPYGTEKVAFLPILLGGYGAEGLETSGNSETTDL